MQQNRCGPRFGWGVVLVGLMTGATAAGAREPSAAHNAALKYWQAFSRLSVLDENQAELLRRQSHRMSLDEAAHRLAESAEPALRDLRRGAAIHTCAWSISIEEGIAALTSHQESAQTLAGAGVLHARLAFDAGRPYEAVDDLLAVMTLGRHLTHDRTLFGMVNGGGVESRAAVVLAEHLPALDAQRVQQVTEALRVLPDPCPLAEVVRLAERAKFDEIMHNVASAGTTDAVIDYLERFHATRDEAAQRVAACGGDAAGVLRHLEAFKDTYHELLNRIEQPLPEFDAWWNAVESDTRAANPMTDLLLPPLVECRRLTARFATSRAMLMAAVDAVRQGDPSAAATHRDPTTGTPFEVTTADGGFELHSSYSRWDRPVVLHVGPSPARP